MDLKLESKRVFISGSTDGIGRQMVKQFADEGAIVILNGINAISTEKTLQELRQKNNNIFSVAGDISTPEGMSNIIKEVSALGGIDILINNAGIYFNHENWFAATEMDWMKLYSVNVIGAVNLIRAFVPGMKKNRWGRIIQISSGEATQPFPFMPDYAATKAAMLNLTVSLSKALGKTGITVNSVSPGLIATEGLKKFYSAYGAAQGWGADWNETEKKILQTVLDNNTGAIGTPEDVANLVCFVASPLAGYINGANLRIDGGSTTSVN